MDPIEITAYRPEWPVRFAELARALREALGEAAVRIDHVGSTAVVGLAAKPIVDIQISVADLDDLEAFRGPLERLGYVYRAENPDRAKRYFREPPGTERTHVHVRQSGSAAEQASLLFRDYLRAHRSAADRYERRKRELATRYRDDRRAYTDGKTPVIVELLRNADAWRQEGAWTPGPSDA